ncbi:RNA-dependent RNA polymerase [Haematococcus lacustris]|uniref:RNA-dependent RNA polymerase n=1 Tax=Haematococcus lacustris TaxID=44745 RepID=A0A699YKB3_HAELA|nr:RNA-dependent RNA polymerase [Haematococcus lacustris]
MDVLLYRSPGLKPQDLQLATLVEAPPAFLDFYFGIKESSPLQPGRQLQRCQALFFSTQGDTCLAACMATGDYDGDLYLGGGAAASGAHTAQAGEGAVQAGSLLALQRLLQPSQQLLPLSRS